MNERIKELAESCIVDFVDGRGISLSEIDVEKFAELIIKECAMFARQFNLEKLDRSHMIHLAMKEKFGIES